MPAPTRVDFYLLTSAEPAERLRFACRLIEKVYKMEKRVHVQARDAAEAAALDELLWTFRQLSFVPHEVVGSQDPGAADAAPPVTIGYADRRPDSGDLLIDLATGAAGQVTGFERIAEIVDASEDSRAAARMRFQRYRQKGIDPVTHTIEARQ